MKIIDLNIEKLIESQKVSGKMLYAAAISSYYDQIGNIVKGDYWNWKILEYSRKGGSQPSILCEAFLNLAISYANARKEDSAVTFIQKASAIALSNNDSAMLAGTYYAYIPVYRKLHLFNQALAYTNKYLNTLPASKKWSKVYTETSIAKAQIYTDLFDDGKVPVYKDSVIQTIRHVTVRQLPVYQSIISIDFNSLPRGIYYLKYSDAANNLLQNKV